MSSSISTNHGLRAIARPAAEEYNPASEKYICLVPEDRPVMNQLKENARLISKLFLSVSPSKLQFRYEEGKWTLLEVLVHLTDCERIYAYRALCFARNESKKLWGFDQDSYTHYAKASERDLYNILEEYSAVRLATIALYNGLPEEALTRMGSTSEFKASVRSLIYHIAGHEINHLRIIREKYLA
jgi:uncharacterized damage-inducible protein DinB